ncbi:uncharacterized protein EMH_0091600 [Eimeria mitis]|uniref:Retrotransposon gag domain-containing protein n=1 Tax=Eimeria mitis TaxID=44415 RepID=U6KEF0_9EIME|nr:uncharacterized protein EMH_0091600 [Eimeria mitis]CDJ34637.1 hypothetical protein EMH_0091600 [Eimeria mitis]
MEVDYEPLTEWGSAHGLELQQAEDSSISAFNSGENAFPPKTIQEECLRLCRPTRYDGRRDAEAVEEFLSSLDLYLRLQNAPEEFQILLAPSLLETDARRWWLHLSNGSTFAEHIRSIQAFRDALRCRFIPTSPSKQAMAELRKLKQGKRSVERYIEKYKSLVNRSPMVAAELHYQWFIAGLEPVWKAQMRSSDVAIEAIPPGSDERVHLSALPTAFAFSMVQGVETVSEEKGSDKAPSLCGGTEETNEDTHALRRDALVKTAVLGE